MPAVPMTSLPPSPDVQRLDCGRAPRQPAPQQLRVDGAALLRRVLPHIGVDGRPQPRRPQAGGRPGAAHQRQRAVPVMYVMRVSST